MWVEKLLAGVLRVVTPLGARYIKPSFARRIYLLWIFRHFKVRAPPAHRSHPPPRPELRTRYRRLPPISRTQNVARKQDHSRPGASPVSGLARILRILRVSRKGRATKIVRR